MSTELKGKQLCSACTEITEQPKHGLCPRCSKIASEGWAKLESAMPITGYGLAVDRINGSKS